MVTQDSCMCFIIIMALHKSLVIESFPIQTPSNSVYDNSEKVANSLKKMKISDDEVNQANNHTRNEWLKKSVEHSEYELKPEKISKSASLSNETEPILIRIRRASGGDMGFTNFNNEKKKGKGKSGKGGGKGRGRGRGRGRKKKGKRGKRKRGGKRRMNLQHLKQKMRRMSKSFMEYEEEREDGSVTGEKRRAVIYSVFGLLCLFI